MLERIKKLLDEKAPKISSSLQKSVSNESIQRLEHLNCVFCTLHTQNGWSLHSYHRDVKRLNQEVLHH